MRIGYFGGSFDPPHLGHLAVARAVLEAFGLDQIVLAPTARQPLKPGGATASFADRLAMVERLCEGEPRFAASALEAPRADGAPNYTVETLRQLHRLQPAAEVFVIVGADAFLTLRAWRSPEELLQLAQWIVVSRPGVPWQQRLPALALTASQLARVHALEGVAEAASATEIRRLLRATETEATANRLRGLLSVPVLSYIREHGLYR